MRAENTHMIDGTLIQQFRRNDLLNNLLEELTSEFFRSDSISVLGRYNNSIHPQRNHRSTLFLVLDSDLGFGIGTKPGKGSRTTSNCHSGIELMCQYYGEWHGFFSFIGGVAKHDALISSPVILKIAMV